jgi:RluA family pseudouridine synthase
VNSAIKISSPATREFWEIPVLFEDEHFLALDKPARLLVAPDADDPTRPSLKNLLHAGIAEKKAWARERNLDFFSNAHELDFETSGILLFAKNKLALAALENLFAAGKAGQKFLALVYGTPSENQFAVEEKIAPHPLKTNFMRVDSQNGKPSQTKFEVVENFSRHGYALLRCEPLTDRPHQIRVHLAHAHLPIVGDELYGGKKLWLSRLKQNFRLKEGREERPLISRAALHAEELNFPHPVTGEILQIKSEWPKDLKVAVKYLKQFAG